MLTKFLANSIFVRKVYIPDARPASVETRRPTLPYVGSLFARSNRECMVPRCFIGDIGWVLGDVFGAHFLRH